MTPSIPNNWVSASICGAISKINILSSKLKEFGVGTAPLPNKVPLLPSFILNTNGPPTEDALLEWLHHLQIN